MGRPRTALLFPEGAGRGHKGPSSRAASPAPDVRLCPLQAGRLFDHEGTVFFSSFVALWAVLFLEYWKRKSATLAYRWGCSDFEDIEVDRPPDDGGPTPTPTPRGRR